MTRNDAAGAGDDYVRVPRKIKVIKDEDENDAKDDGQKEFLSLLQTGSRA